METLETNADTERQSAEKPNKSFQVAREQNNFRFRKIKKHIFCLLSPLLSILARLQMEKQAKENVKPCSFKTKGVQNVHFLEGLKTT